MRECRHLRQCGHEDGRNKEDQHRCLSPPHTLEGRCAQPYQCEYEVGRSGHVDRREEPRSGRKKICGHDLRQTGSVPESPQREAVHRQMENIDMEEVMSERHVPRIPMQPHGASEQQQHDKKHSCSHYDVVSTSSHTSLSCHCSTLSSVQG